MDTLIQIGQIIFILSVLVILHEFGHYIPAKLFKVRVEKFYLFMDAGFSLFKKKIKETEWGIGWLPIGGYVKLSGMMDESMDKEQMQQPAQPWEFRSKPAWQRLIIMLGGITVNILLAWFLYTMLYSTYGQKYTSTTKIQENGLAFGDVGIKVGFKNGDKIVSVDGNLQERFNRTVIDILLGTNIVVERNGQQKTLTLTDENKADIFKKEGKDFIGARTPLNSIYIDSVSGKNTVGAALKAGDRLIGFNTTKINYFDELADSLKVSKSKPITLDVIRQGKPVKLTFVLNNYKDFTDNVSLSPLMELKNTRIGDYDGASVAEKAGVIENDVLLGFNNQKFQYFHEFKKALQAKSNQSIALNVLRNGNPVTINMVVGKNGKVGLSILNNLKDPFEVVHKMSLSEAIPAAINESYTQFLYNIKQFKLILRPKTEAYKQVKSPIGITQKLPTHWSWEFVWSFTAMFSIGLAFMNLLPIPGLDGGHAIFTIAEMITGRKLSDKAAERVQTFGMIILLSLMALTFGKDIVELVSKKFF